MLTEDQYFADEEENEDQEYCDYCGEPAYTYVEEITVCKDCVSRARLNVYGRGRGLRG
jgi:hypothetical protein